MSVSNTQSGDWRLASVAGPTAILLTLHPPGPLTIGRRPEHNLELPDRLVSRDHARLSYRPAGTDAGSTGGEWVITDLDSKHGTWLNGRQLRPGEPMPLRVGDFVAIAPWTLRVEDPMASSHSTLTVTAIDDTQAAGATIMPVQSQGVGALAQQRLALLLRCAETLQGVHSEADLAEAVLDAAVAGTGFSNAAILHPMTPDGQIEIVNYRGAVFAGGSQPAISLSLVRQAGEGSPARRSRMGNSAAALSQSIVELSIEEALCVPIRLESAVVSLLYLDDRSASPELSRKSSDAAEFAIGLARLAGLALANLRRLDVERRQGQVEAELNAAAEVQRWVMPRRGVWVGPFRCMGESRPGQYIGGDFFDVIPLDDQRLAVAVGDVSGKGVAASVLTTVSQGYLHAALGRTGDPAKAVTELNEYLGPRCPAGRFLTLWVGVFDGRDRTLTCVDAGHGYAFLNLAGEELRPLEAGQCDLVGISSESTYRAAVVQLPPAGRVLIVSDGFIEQPAVQPEAHEESCPDAGDLQEPDGAAPAGLGLFGVEGIQACMAAAPAGSDAVAALIEAVCRHAGTSALNDDATAVVVEWGQAPCDVQPVFSEIQRA